MHHRRLDVAAAAVAAVAATVVLLRYLARHFAINDLFACNILETDELKLRHVAALIFTPMTAL